MATAAVLLRLRRAHPSLLHYRRLISTTTRGGAPGPYSNYPSLPFPSSVEFEKKWKQLSDTYAIHGRILSETINSRQDFVRETIKRNMNHQNNNRLMHLKELLLKQDEIAEELTDYKLTYLTNIITPLPPEDFPFGGYKLKNELLWLRLEECRWMVEWRRKGGWRSVEVEDMLLKEDEQSAELTISRVTSLQETFTNLPPSLDQFVREHLISGLHYLIYLELDEAQVFSMRSNGGPIPSKRPAKKLYELRPSPLTPPRGIVYENWLNPPPQPRLQFQTTSPPAQLMLNSCL